jgi:outer membrane receptor protein involved in Fe transport
VTIRPARLALLLAGFIALAGPAIAQTPGQIGRVVGKVIDEVNGFALPGVTVADTSGRAVHTDLDGNFSIEVPVGPQTLMFVLMGYADQTVTVTLRPGQALTLDVGLSLTRFAETIEVRGTATDLETSSSAAALAIRRTAVAISDNLGAQELKNNADSNAAAGLQRVTGLSVVGGGFTFVRGLGERYSNTTLAGSTIPSTQPERRVIPLDIFPAGLLDSVSVVKSYTPDRPAEFAGGLVEIIPLKIANRPVFDASYSFGGNTRTMGKDGLDYTGSGTDWLGFDDGRRQLPAGIPDDRVIRGGIYTPDVGMLRSELETLGESFENLWTPRAANGKPNHSWSLVYGNRWGGFGLIGSINHSYRSQYQKEIQNYFRLEGSSLSPFSEYEYRVSENKATLAGTATAAYQFTSNNRVAFQYFTTNIGQRESRTFEGYNSDFGRDIRNSRILWVEENLNTGQFTGDHLFPQLSNTRIDWRTSYSRSNRDEPDLREMLYEDIGGFRLADQSQSGFRMFNDLTEDSVDVAFNWSTSFTNWAGLPTMVKFGPNYTKRDRDFSSRRFRFIPIVTQGVDLTLPAERLYAPQYIGPNFELREETRPTDTYRADQTVAAFYGMLDLPLAARWRVIGGLRVEQFEQRVNTFDPFSLQIFGDAREISAESKKTDAFPSANLVYAVRPDQNIRFGVSQTVNRPEFRELSPFEFTDIVGGRAVIGNPGLTRALVRNYDVRWEWFPGAEQVIAGSFFVKQFEDPIERFVEPTAQLRTSYTNADSARNVGFELEARKAISSHFFAGANYTYIDSEIELTPFQTNVLTSLVRPLAGTSKSIFNGMAEARFKGTTVRFLLNYFSDRIIDVGSLGLPDIFEAGRATIDLAVSKRLDRVNLRFSLDNLTDRQIEFTQGTELQRAYKLGRTLVFQVGYSLF